MRKIIEKHESIIIFSKRIENLYSDIALILFVSDSLIICCIGFVLVTVSNYDERFQYAKNVLKHSSNVAKRIFYKKFTGNLFNFNLYITLRLCWPLNYFFNIIMYILYKYTYTYIYIYMIYIIYITSIIFNVRKSIGRPNAATIIVKSLGFYLIMNFEVFMFCFAGEYLSSKVNINIYNILLINKLNFFLCLYNSLAYRVEQLETLHTIPVGRFQDRRIILFLIMRSQNQLTITVGKFMNLSLERYVSVRMLSKYFCTIKIRIPT